MLLKGKEIKCAKLSKNKNKSGTKLLTKANLVAIDIHSKKDLYLAEMAMRYAKKNKFLDH